VSEPVTLSCELLKQNLKFANFSAVEIRMGLDVTDVVTNFIYLIWSSMGLQASDFAIFGQFVVFYLFFLKYLVML